MTLSTELKIGGAILVIFVAIVSFSILGYGSKQQPAIKTTIPSTTTTTPTTATFSTSEVAKHNNQNDCWIIINNSVYNVTDYLFAHPGGAGMIIPYCGADATSAFKGMRKHDSRANAELAKIIIGSIK